MKSVIEKKKSVIFFFLPLGLFMEELLNTGEKSKLYRQCISFPQTTFLPFVVHLQKAMEKDSAPLVPVELL